MTATDVANDVVFISSPFFPPLHSPVDRREKSRMRESTSKSNVGGVEVASTTSRGRVRAEEERSRDTSRTAVQRAADQKLCEVEITGSTTNRRPKLC